MREVQWQLMFPDELEQAFEQCPVVYFTYGLCEPHGPQNALGWMRSRPTRSPSGRRGPRRDRCAARLLAHPRDRRLWQLGEEVVGRPARHWTTGMPPWQHFKNVLYHIRAADALGFKAAILLTGHYGPNWEDLKTLVRLVQPSAGTRLYGLPEFESNYKGFAGDGQETGDHAGKVETSLLWALRPECVDVSRIPDQYRPGPGVRHGRERGRVKPAGGRADGRR